MEPHHFLRWRICHVCRHHRLDDYIPVCSVVKKMREPEGRFPDNVMIYAVRLGSMKKAAREDFLRSNGWEKKCGQEDSDSSAGAGSSESAEKPETEPSEWEE